MRSSSSSFNFQYPLVSLKSSRSWLRLLPHLHVTYIPPCIFPSIMCFRRQFVCKTWPIQLTFLLFIVCKIFLSSFTLCNTSYLTWSVQLIFALAESTRSNALCQYINQAHNSSPTSKVSSYTRWFKYDRDKLWLVYTQIVPVIFEPPCIILSITITPLVPFLLLHPNWSSPTTSSIFLSTLLLSNLASLLYVRWLLHFVAFDFFLKAIIVTSVKSLDHSPGSYC